MKPSENSVDEFIRGISHQKRQRDARTLVGLLREATGEEPRMWGAIVGFGQYDYKYPTGTKGIAPAAGFSPRKSASTVYLSDGIGAHTEQLNQLGEHTTGMGCVYIKDLDAIDLDILGQIVTDSYESLRHGTYTKRAREGGSTDS